MFTTLDKSSEKSFYSVNSASVCLYWIQASVIVERGGGKDMLALLSLPPSLCCRLCRAVMFACIWERHSQPRRRSADISARKVTDEFGANLIIPDRIKMLPVEMLWHMDTLSPPMFFNNFTHTISFPTAILRGGDADSSLAPLRTLMPPVTFSLLCTNTLLTANWWAVLIRTIFRWPGLSLWGMFYRPITDIDVFGGAFISGDLMQRQQSCWLITHQGAWAMWGS